MKRSNHPDYFLSVKEREAVEESIRKAEEHTSGEIKLVVIRHCWGRIESRIIQIFNRMGLARTRKHNAILILLVSSNRELAIYGDRGINKKMEDDFWLDVRDEMLEQFRKDSLGDGLCAGVRMIGEKLSEFFPTRSDDQNEISNEVEYVE